MSPHTTRPGRLSLGLLLLSSLVASCGGDNFEETKSNDIEVSPTSLFFNRPNRTGEVLGEKITIDARGGETPLTVTGITIEGYEACNLFEQGVNNVQELPPDVKAQCYYAWNPGREVPFTLSPEGVGTDTGDPSFIEFDVYYQAIDTNPPAGTDLVVTSNVVDRDKQEIRVSLNVQAASPRISVAPTVVAFPGVAMGSETLLLRNTGNGPLEVYDVRLEYLTAQPQDENGAPIDEYRIELLDPDLPWVVNEQDAQEIRVIYEPADDVADEAVLVVDSNDPENNPLRITVTSSPVFAVLEVGPNPVRMPALGQGMSRTLVTLRNTGAKNLEVLDVKTTGEGYRIASATSFTIPPGQAVDSVEVVYQPADPNTPNNGTLQVVSNANNGADNPEFPGDARRTVVEVPLVASGGQAPASLTVDPAAIDFSDVALGMSQAQSVTLRNTGESDLVISSIAMGEVSMGVGSDPEFSISSGGVDADLTLAPGDTHTVEVTFARPAEMGRSHIAALVIESNVVGGASTVYLTASAPAEE
ncbi:MAG: choice-of-anchor D domain-containing protein [Bradymonadia bacterium]